MSVNTWEAVNTWDGGVVFPPVDWSQVTITSIAPEGVIQTTPAIQVGWIVAWDSQAATITVEADGTVTATSVPVTFDAAVNDGTGWGSAGQITLSSADSGPAIIISGGSATGDQDTVLSATLVVSDPDGLPPTGIFAVASQGSNGVAAINADTGAWTYTPNAGFYGNDGFGVQVTDALSFTSTVSLTVVVNPVDSGGAVIVSGGSATGDENTVLSNTLVVTDPDGLPSTGIFAIGSQGSSGAAAINADTGAWTYTPNTGFYGGDSFGVAVTDAKGFTSTVTLTVVVNPVDSGGATIISGGSASGEMNTVLSNTLVVSDPDGLPANNIFAISSQGTNGAATINANSGAWTYTPNASYVGGDAFGVEVTDAKGFNSVVTLNVTVLEPAPMVPSTIDGVEIQEALFRTAGNSNLRMVGDVQVLGLEEIQVECGGFTATLTWNVNQYEGSATDIATFLAGEVGNTVPIRFVF